MKPRLIDIFESAILLTVGRKVDYAQHKNYLDLCLFLDDYQSTSSGINRIPSFNEIVSIISSSSEDKNKSYFNSITEEVDYNQFSEILMEYYKMCEENQKILVISSKNHKDYLISYKISNYYVSVNYQNANLEYFGVKETKVENPKIKSQDVHSYRGNLDILSNTIIGQRMRDSFKYDEYYLEAFMINLIYYKYAKKTAINDFEVKGLDICYFDNGIIYYPFEDGYLVGKTIVRHNINSPVFPMIVDEDSAAALEMLPDVYIPTFRGQQINNSVDLSLLSTFVIK
ncbi:MAG: hypothetical protein QW255_05360 [Candidatus Bilamarchaeaceae archaeon]